MSENTVMIVFRIVGITLTFVSASASLLLLTMAWYLGPESSPPVLQLALISFTFPLLMSLLALLARPLGNVAYRGFPMPNNQLHPTAKTVSVMESQSRGG